MQLARSFISAGASVALAGPAGRIGPVAAETAIAAALLNYAAGRIGETVDFSRPHALTPPLARRKLETSFPLSGPDDILFVHDTNPLYSRAGAASQQVSRAGMVVYLGTLMDETAQRADWFLPVDSPLESWGNTSLLPASTA